MPDGVREHFEEVSARVDAPAAPSGGTDSNAIDRHPDLAEQLFLMQHRELPKGWDDGLPVFPADEKGVASRDSSSKVLNVLAQRTPWLLGGAADLAPSTKTRLTFDGAGDLNAENRGARNMHFGIREHAMGAVVNGLSLSKMRPFGSTFLIFSDYVRPSIRLSALMEVPAIYIFTHDSIGVGEDGPTHQPIEQLASLRAIPGLMTLRPADANEVVEAWRVIMQLRHEPVALVLTRQPLPTFDRSKVAPAAGVARGAYVLAIPPVAFHRSCFSPPVAKCRSAWARWIYSHAMVFGRASSACHPGTLEKQPQDYRAEVLPPTRHGTCVRRAGRRSMEPHVGPNGICLGMKTFGASAPLQQLQQKFGFTAERVAAAARRVRG